MPLFSILLSDSLYEICYQCFSILLLKSISAVATKSVVPHVLFAVTAPVLGGAERQLCYFLKNYDRSRLRCSVLTVLSSTSPRCIGKTDFRQSLNEASVPVHSLDFKRFPTYRGLVSLTKKIRQISPDIIQSYGLAVDLTIRNLPLGHVFKIGSMRGTEDHRSSTAFLIDGLTSRIQSSGYISNSHAGKQTLIKRGWVSTDQICVIPNGIDPLPFINTDHPAAHTAIRQSLQIKENTTVIICIANIYPQKGHSYLLKAIRSIADSFSIKLLLVGEDRTNGELQRLIQQLSLEEIVEALGTRCDIPELLAGSDIFMLPSLQEGMPNAILEAMSAGLPIIGTSVGDISQMLDNGGCGTVVKKADADQLASAIERYLCDPAFAQLHGKCARDRVIHRYSLENMVLAHEDLYINLIKKQRYRFAS